MIRPTVVIVAFAVPLVIGAGRETPVPVTAQETGSSRGAGAESGFPVEPAPITASTGEPIVSQGWTPLPLLTKSEFAAQAGEPSFPGVSDEVVEVRAWPRDLSPDAKYGWIRLGGRLVTYVIDGDDSAGYTLRLDLDADGDLTGEAARPLVRDEDLYAVIIDAPAGAATDGTRSMFKLGLPQDRAAPMGHRLRFFSETRRRGAVRLGAREIPFALVGRDGIYDAPYNVVFFDTDADGRLDTENSDSDEAYRVEEETVNLHGRSYRFHVDRHGDRLTLTPLRETLPERARLAPGNPAPDFAFVDVNARAGRLSDYRGRVVLLYFWGTWCGPCRKATPQLVEAYTSYKDDGFEILGIDKRDTLEVLRSYAERNGMTWPQILEGDEGPIRELYRVSHWPTLYLIDADGTIVANRIRAGDLAESLNHLLAPWSPAD